MCYLILGKVHEPAPVSMISSIMRRELQVKLKEIGDQIAEGLNLEKRAWSKLHDVEDDVTVMMAEIDKSVEDKDMVGR